MFIKQKIVYILSEKNAHNSVLFSLVEFLNKQKFSKLIKQDKSKFVYVSNFARWGKSGVIKYSKLSKIQVYCFCKLLLFKDYISEKHINIFFYLVYHFRSIIESANLAFFSDS
jgi:hypothetical protein